MVEWGSEYQMAKWPTMCVCDVCVSGQMNRTIFLFFFFFFS